MFEKSHTHRDSTENRSSLSKERVLPVGADRLEIMDSCHVFRSPESLLAHAVIDSPGGIWMKSVRAPDNKPEQRDERKYLE
jgi:hypothetical protein